MVKSDRVDTGTIGAGNGLTTPNEREEQRSAATPSVRWVVYGRVMTHPHNQPPSKREWIEWLTFFSEADGVEAMDEFRIQYPHYEIELRKATTTEERVDA